MRYCPKCGTEYRDGFNKCADCDVLLVDNPPTIKQSKEKYGSLLKRFISTVIDSFIISIPLFIFWIFGGAKVINSLTRFGSVPFDDPALKIQLMWINLVYLIFYCSISVAYATFYIGKYGQSLGQKIVGLKVVSEEEKNLDYRKAFFRALAYLIYDIPFIGSFIMLISVINILSSDKRQAIHDRICKTVVLST